MKHIIFGGDGFLGTELTKKLVASGQQVLVCDIKQTVESGIYDDKSLVSFVELDVTDKTAFNVLRPESGDMVYHFAARLLVPILPRAQRKEYFWQALYVGTENVFAFMMEHGLRHLVYFTTDMVYGHTVEHPRTEDHPRSPLGPYGEAKYQTELLCDKYRKQGFNITLFRPRLIIGPGRLGILEKLFKLIDYNLPVPTIGSGSNFYQFISVSDCAEACICAMKADCPNEDFNLGSLNPPAVNDLLRRLIDEAGSKSFLLPTPAWLVKLVLGALDRLGMPIMDPEQYLIADETCVLDVSKGKAILGWEPQDNDVNMLFAAYRDYRENLDRDQSLLIGSSTR